MKDVPVSIFVYKFEREGKVKLCQSCGGCINIEKLENGDYLFENEKGEKMIINKDDFEIMKEFFKRL